MNKLGICLSGGGARGAYQIGALKALEDLGIYENVKAISGTSIGAANAAIVGSNSISAAKEFWFSIHENPLKKEKNIFTKLKEEKLRSIESGLYTLSALDDVLLEGLLPGGFKDKDVIIAVTDSGSNSKGILELVKSSVSHYIIKDSRAVYINLKDVNHNEMADIVKASCSIPIVFPPVVNDEKKYYDGGVVDNVPLQPLIAAGCNEIISINIAFYNFSKKIKKKYPNIKIHEIKSSNHLGGILDFSTEHSEKIFQYGYDDVMKYYNK